MNIIGKTILMRETRKLPRETVGVIEDIHYQDGERGGKWVGLMITIDNELKRFEIGDDSVRFLLLSGDGKDK